MGGVAWRKGGQGRRAAGRHAMERLSHAPLAVVVAFDAAARRVIAQVLGRDSRR